MIRREVVKVKVDLSAPGWIWEFEIVHFQLPSPRTGLGNVVVVADCCCAGSYD